jgi:hypothetical protein
MSVQVPPTSKGLSQLAKEIIILFSDTFGIELEDLSLETDLVEDFDLKSDLEGLARFLHAVNTKYEVDIKLGHIVADLDEQTISTLADLITIIEEAQLE